MVITAGKQRTPLIAYSASRRTAGVSKLAPAMRLVPDHRGPRDRVFSAGVTSRAETVARVRLFPGGRSGEEPIIQVGVILSGWATRATVSPGERPGGAG